MTTYLDLQTAGRHMFPIEARAESLAVRIGKLIKAISDDRARAKAHQSLQGMSDHMLKDIGVERHTLSI